MAVLVSIDVQDQVGAPLDGVNVRLYQSDGTTFVTEATTGAPFAAGRAEVTLPGAVSPGTTYVARLFRQGYYFAANGQRQLVQVIEPAPGGGNIYGPYVAIQGSSAELVTLNLLEGAQPVDNVLVRVYSAADAFLAEGVSGSGGDAPGAVTLALVGAASPGTPYIVRFYSQGLLFTLGPTQLISVVAAPIPPASNIFDIELTTPSLPQAQDLNLCRVYGKLVDASLAPLAGRTLDFLPVPCWPEHDPRVTSHFLGTPTVVGNQVVYGPKRATSNRDGIVDVELPRGGVFRVRMSGHSHPLYVEETVEIPDQSAVALEDLLFPYVVSVSFTGGSYALQAGSSLDVTVVVLMSGGQTITSVEALMALLDFTSSDEVVASVEVTGPDSIRITGVAAGSATIQVARKTDVVAPRLPAVPALTFTPPPVVVS